MDVVTAYLNASLQEPIFMSQPPGYREGTSNSVLLLRKCLYGLKQLGREWYECLCKVLASISFRKSSSGAAVDNLTITAPTEAILFGVKEDLIKVFRMKDLR